jgi:hypothetical protein
VLLTSSPADARKWWWLLSAFIESLCEQECSAVVDVDAVRFFLRQYPAAAQVA